MSSPARSSVSATSAGQGGSSSNAGLADENSPFPFPADLLSAQDRKDEALLLLKSDVMAALQKEVKSLDEDSWKFAGPRSQIHLISKPELYKGGLMGLQGLYGGFAEVYTGGRWFHSPQVFNESIGNRKQMYSRCRLLC